MFKKTLLIIGVLASVILLSFSPKSTPPYQSLCDEAVENNKKILIYFCGSDWCAVCNKFKKNVLNTSEVKKTIETDYVYHIADFPQRTKLSKELETLNDALAEKLNNEGVFPLLVIADKNLNVIKIINSSVSEKEALEALKNNK